MVDRGHHTPTPCRPETAPWPSRGALMIVPAHATGGDPPVPRIPYPDLSTIDDPEILGYLEDARLHGAPRPESQAIRAHVPAVIRAFSQAWQTTFRTGVLDHALK